MDDYSEILTFVFSDYRNLCTKEELELSLKQSIEHFNEVDTNSDGFLKLDDVKLLCESMGLPVSEDEEDLMSKMDTDGSGTLEKGEWVKWWLTRISHLPNPKKQQEAIARNTFKRFDEDGSGRISIEEFVKLTEFLGVNFTSIEIQQAGLFIYCSLDLYRLFSIAP